MDGWICIQAGSRNGGLPSELVGMRDGDRRTLVDWQVRWDGGSSDKQTRAGGQVDGTPWQMGG